MSTSENAVDDQKTCWYKCIAWPALLFLVLLLCCKSHHVGSLWRRFKKSLMAHVILKGLERTYNEAMVSHKRRLFDPLTELSDKSLHPISIVEIGTGGGANFQYFPKGSRITCVEPNDECEGYIRKNAESRGLTLDSIKVCFAEDMSFIKSESVDVVVCTLVLCTVHDMDQSLREVLRILRPGGMFFFLEHIVAEPDSWTVVAQRLFNPLRVLIADCHFTRASHVNIEKAGFTSVNVKLFHAKELQSTPSLWWRIAYMFVSRHAIGHAIK